MNTKRSTYANESEVNQQDAPALDGIAAREDDLGAEPGTLAQDDVLQPVGAHPVNESPTLDDDQTDEGLTPSEEALVRNVENTQSGEIPDDDVPVFDRAQQAPKI